MRKNRIFNTRPICFFVLFLSAGIIIGEALSESNPFFRLIPLSVFILALSVFAVFRKTRRFAYIWVASAMGLILISGSYDIISSVISEDYSGYAQARVVSEIIVDSERTSFTVDDIYINGREIKGKASVFLYKTDAPDFGAGDIIGLNGSLFREKHKPFDTFFANKAAKGLLYYVIADDTVKISEGKPGFPLNFQLTVKKLLYYNLDEYSSSICQALLLGDKSGMDDNLYGDVKASGLAHVLAVSGLHISALAGALYWLLKKLKVNPKISFVVVTALTFVYVMLCSFTPSALRAFIMTAVFTFASAFGFKRDNLSSLALSACLILLFRSTALFEVGFLLSMFAMLGIFLFYKPINDFLMRGVTKISPKRKIGTKAAGIVSVSLASNIATYPLTAYFFKSVPALFILSNLIILPYLMFIYLFLMVITAFALITTLSGTVGIMYYLLLPFKAFISMVGSVSFANVPVSISVAGIVSYSLSMVILSRYVFLTKKQKLASVCFVVATAMALPSALLLGAVF